MLPVINKQLSNPVIQTQSYSNIYWGGGENSSKIKGYEHLTKETIMFPNSVIKFFNTMKTCPGVAFELEDYRKNPTDHEKKKVT